MFFSECWQTKRNVVSCCVQLKLHKLLPQPVEAPIQVCAVSDVSSVSAIPEIQTVITKFSHLFQEPSSLPPERQCDHTIPLIPGAQPVNVRSYHYAPAQKTEIEKQLAEMLRQGTIRCSSNPYASPVQLGTSQFNNEFFHNR